MVYASGPASVSLIFEFRFSDFDDFLPSALCFGAHHSIRNSPHFYPAHYAKLARASVLVSSVAFGAGEVEEDLLGLVVRLFFGDDVGEQELVADVGENGGAARRDAAFGHEEAEKALAKVLGGGEVGAFGEEVLGEVGGVNGK